MSTAEQLRRNALPPLLVVSTAWGGLSVVARTGLAETRLTQAPSAQMLPIEAQWCLERSTPKQPQVCIALEVADDHNERRLGLMHRPPLPPQRGMWFDFKRPAPISMWMLNTPASLDMVFVRDGAVVAVEARRPPCRAIPCPGYFADRNRDGSPDPVDGVIELGAGEAARLGIDVGDGVSIQRVRPATTGYSLRQ